MIIILQEQVNDKTVNLTIQSGKLTARTFQKGVMKLYNKMKQRKNKQTDIPHGKQTVKELVGQNAGVVNIEITDRNIKSFDRVARKYGVDYALKKDITVDPPKWLVFFKARDSDALMAALKEYGTMKIKKQDKPSVINTLNENVEKIKNQVKDKEKVVRRGAMEL